MNSIALVVLLALVPLISSLKLGSNGERGHQVFADSCQKDQNFGYVLLAVQWAPSFCQNTPCGDRNRNGWTVHGSWPQHTNNSWPQYCCFESEFNVTKIKSLEKQMVDKWPSLKVFENFCFSLILSSSWLLKVK